MRVVLLVALALALSACDREKSDSIRLSNQGTRALKAGDHKQAFAWFRDAAGLDPDNASARYGMGLVEIELGDLDKARDHFKIAASLKPELVEATYQLGWIAIQQQKLDEADAALRRVVELQPEHAAAYFLMGSLREKKGQLKEADEAWRRAVALDPYRPETFLALARLYLRVGAEKESVLVLREAIRVITPDKIETPTGLALLQNELGTMLLQTGQYGEAIDALLAGLRLDGTRFEIAFNLGCAYASKGDPEKALDYFRRYLDLARGDDETVTIARDVAKHLEERLQKGAGKGS